MSVRFIVIGSYPVTTAALPSDATEITVLNY